MANPRTVVITGASSGIGLAAAVALARQGDHVALVGRHAGRLARATERVAAVAAVPPTAYRADFAVLDQVRRVAEEIRADHQRIDVLVNNAGQLAPRSRTTVDGYDVTMQVNHLAGFLLTHLLRDRLLAAPIPGTAGAPGTAGSPGPAGSPAAGATGPPSAPARVITTGSLAEAWGWLDVHRPADRLRRYRSRWLAYGASKQANLLFTIEAARRWAGDAIVPTCFFPGLVQTRFARSSLLFRLAWPLLFRTPAQGADTLVWLATAAEALVPGGYFAYRAPFVATPRATNPDRAAALWEASLRAVGLPS